MPVRRNILDLHDTAHMVGAHRRHPHRGIVDQHIEAAEMGNRAAHTVAAGSRVRHVHGQRDCPIGAEFALETKDAVRGRVAKRHAHAGTDNGAREGLADTAGGAGNERDSAVEVGYGHWGLPVDWRGKFLYHLYNFARARYGRSPDTIELGNLCSQRCRVQNVLGLFDTWELIEGDVNERVGPAPGAPSSLSLELLYSARKMFCPIPTIELLPIGQVGQSCANDENGCSHGRLLGGLFLRNWQ